MSTLDAIVVAIVYGWLIMGLLTLVWDQLTWRKRAGERSSAASDQED